MIGNDWDDKLNIIWGSEGFKKFYKIIEEEYRSKIIYPPKENIFEALKLTSYKNTKVVIVGQDPYHGEGEAHGLSFSVQKGIKIPPSLQNIYKELENDLKIKPSLDGDLTKWAKEGILLLNAVLTVEKDKPASHKGLGWELLTDFIINSGTFGNKSTLSAQDEIYRRKGTVIVKKVSILKVAFLSYKNMCIRYPLLNRVPILLPYYWLVRITNNVGVNYEYSINRETHTQIQESKGVAPGRLCREDWIERHLYWND